MYFIILLPHPFYYVIPDKQESFSILRCNLLFLTENTVTVCDAQQKQQILNLVLIKSVADELKMQILVQMTSLKYFANIYAHKQF